MQVAETNIQFNTLIPRKATRRIVLHHSASRADTTWQDIHQWHLNNGWAGIGYHYVIHADGGIYRGRPEGMSGAHAYQDRDHEANSDGIGICIVGNFETGVPTEAQLASTVDLIRDIRTRHPGISVIGHRDVMATACPGPKFPWDRLFKDLQGGGTVADKDTPAAWAKESWERAKKEGYLDGTRPKDAVTREELAVVLNRLTGKLGGK